MPDLATELARGKAMREAGDHAAALAAFEAAVWADPQHLDARAELGFGLLALGRLAAAEPVFTGVLATAPLHGPALAGLAQVRRRRGDAAGALECVRLALAAASTNAGLQVEAGYDLLALGRVAEAEAAFRAVAGPDVRGLLGLGHAARRRGDRAAALARFREALAAAPGSIDAQLELAAELAEAGDLAGAEALVAAVLADRPENLPARMQRGQIARRAGDLAGALDHFAAAAAAHPDAAAPQVACAETLLAAGRPAEAEAAAGRVLAADPANLGALLLRSEIAWLAQDLETCLDLARRAMAAHPSETAPVLQATRALMDLGRAEEALALLAPAGAALGWPAAFRAREVEICRRHGLWEEGRAALAACGSVEDFGLGVQRGLFHLARHELAEAAAAAERVPARTCFERACRDHLRGEIAEAGWQLAQASDHYRAAAAGDAGFARPHGDLARVRLLLFDLDGAIRHQRELHRLDAAAHLLRRERRRDTATLLGQVWDEMRADAALGAEVRAALALPPDGRIAALRALLRAQPDSLAPSLLLLVALRQAGAWAAAPPAPEGAPAIPRHIGQFWDETEPPGDVAALMATWAARHPDWHYTRFDRATAGAWLTRHAPRAVVAAYIRAKNAAQKADIFRLAWLAQAGGVWADADDRCVGRLEALAGPGAALAGAQEHLGSLGNNLLAAAPGHPVIRRALMLGTEALNRGDADITWLLTGPGMLSRALAQEIAESPAPIPAALAGIRLIERGEAARFAVFQVPAGYKRTGKSWTRAELSGAGGAPMDGVR